MALALTSPADRLTGPWQRVSLTTADVAFVAKLRLWKTHSDRNAELSDRVEELLEAAAVACPVPLEIRHAADNPYATLSTYDLGKHRENNADLAAQIVKLLGLAGHEKEVDYFIAEVMETDRKLAMIEAHEANVAAERARNGHDALRRDYEQSARDMLQVEQQIAAEPAAGFTGVLVKLVLYNQFTAFDEVEKESDLPDNRLLSGALRDLQRLSGLTIGQLFGE